MWLLSTASQLVENAKTSFLGLLNSLKIELVFIGGESKPAI